MGMYGLILVEPDGGLPPVDREFYVMQGDMYTKWAAGTEGHQEFDLARMSAEDPTYVVFNGKFQALTGSGALQADVNDTIRIYFGVGGPNLISSFHVIGEMFDRVYSLGDVLSPPMQMVQTILVPPGGASIVDFALEVPGDYILVDHALVRSIDKGSVGILTVTGPEDWSIFKP
jgi:nitrite reductase (NO-forming)